MVIRWATLPAFVVIFSLAAGAADEPAFTITSPTHGSDVSGTVTIAAEVIPSQTLFKAEFFINNVLAYTTGGLPFTYDWNTTSEPDVPATLTVKAHTPNQSTSQTINVTIANGALTPVPAAASRVTVSGSQLIVEKRLPDGSLAAPEPYLMKGVTWTPAARVPLSGPDPWSPAAATQYGFFFDWPGRNPPGSAIYHEWLRNRFLAHYKTDIDLMAQMNVNTVRIYMDLGTEPQAYRPVLDELYKRGIMVIMTVALAKADIDSGRYLNAVNLAKHHPAILMWSLGNEWNFNNYYGYADAHQAALATEQAAQAIKSADSNHPVTSTLGDRFTLGSGGSCGDDPAGSDIPAILAKVPSVALWGLQIYRGASFGPLFSQWKSISPKPFYLGEMGTDSFASSAYIPPPACQGAVKVTGGAENQSIQAGLAVGLWNEIKPQLSAYDPTRSCVGGLVHEFSDAVYKVGNYNTGLGGLVNYEGPDGLPNTPDDDHSYDHYNPDGFVIPGAHPDNVANEEYFGIVTADRQPKAIFQSLQTLYAGLAAPGSSPDIGLKFYDGTQTVHIAAEPQGAVTSPLRIRKGNTTYGVQLVPPSDPNASKMIIHTKDGKKAVKKL